MAISVPVLRGKKDTAVLLDMRYFYKITPVHRFGMKAQKEYRMTDACTLAQRQTKVAVCPVDISYCKTSTSVQLRYVATSWSVFVQREIYFQVLMLKAERRFSREIQDIHVTNSRVNKAGLPSVRVSNRDLCKALDVDGLIRVHITFPRPIAPKGLPGVVAYACRRLTICRFGLTISAYDAASDQVLWSSKIKKTVTAWQIFGYVSNVLKQKCEQMPYITT